MWAYSSRGVTGIQSNPSGVRYYFCESHDSLWDGKNGLTMKKAPGVLVINVRKVRGSHGTNTNHHPIWKHHPPAQRPREGLPISRWNRPQAKWRRCLVNCSPGFPVFLDVPTMDRVQGADCGVVLGRQVQVLKSLKKIHISEAMNPVPCTRKPLFFFFFKLPL